MATPIKLAIVCGVLRPYRLHYHRRLARELTGVELHTVVLYERSLMPVGDLFDPAIRPILFGPGESVARHGRVSCQPAHFKKGGSICRWLRREQIDAVVLLGYDDASLWRIARFCKRTGKPCFLWADSNIRSPAPVGWRAPAKRQVLTKFLTYCAGVMTCGRLGRQYFQQFGVPAERIFFSPYEPDYDEIESLPTAFVESVASELELAPGRRRLLYSGRLTARKRVDLALRAFLASADVRPEWDLVLMGQGDQEAVLRGMVDERLGGRVRFLPFFDDPKRVAAVNKSCDVLVLPSDREAWALVVNEAVAGGMAVIASDAVGAAYELVRDRINGRIFPRGDEAALRQALLDVTEPGTVDATRAASRQVLADWRRDADPVDGVRRALRSVGLSGA